MISAYFKRKEGKVGKEKKNLWDSQVQFDDFEKIIFPITSKDPAVAARGQRWIPAMEDGFRRGKILTCTLRES